MYKQIAANKRNTIIIMVGFVILIALIGCGFAYGFDDWSIAGWTLGIATVYAVIQYFLSNSLAVAMSGAKEIEKKDNPKLYNAVENITMSAGLPMPKVYIINDPAPNAFASGRDPDHAIIAATTGLLDILDKKELEAVIAHEASHIKNYDIRVSMITFGLVSIVGFIADIGTRMLFFGRRRNDEDRSPLGFIIVLVISILAPIAAALAQMAVSREREYLADASAVNITRYPEGLISALKKLDTHTQPMMRQNAAMEAMYINKSMKKGLFGNLFSTHPPIEKRIERIEHGKKNF